ncbi:hypothetical protein NDU88_003216 [Pleurodeles waltl]|uniref:Uncharacterized protein n=1 Tax=Pleurodeles waltl TaxID=8319 RepID=A0AAV7T5X4_PLEWA|nr:hypothetical protein NDU88_003216 [Pleurodeles waltl]
MNRLCGWCREAAGTPRGVGTPTGEEGGGTGPCSLGSWSAGAVSGGWAAKCGRVLSGLPAPRWDAEVAQEGPAAVECSKPRAKRAGAEASARADLRGP